MRMRSGWLVLATWIFGAGASVVACGLDAAAPTPDALSVDAGVPAQEAGDDGSDVATSDAGDASITDATGQDVAFPTLIDGQFVLDAPSEADASAPVFPAGALPLYTGTAPVQIEGVTSDGHAIFAVLNTNGKWSLYAAMTDGSSGPILIEDSFDYNSGYSKVLVGPSPMIMIWSGCSLPSTGILQPPVGVCALSFWSPTLGYFSTGNNGAACVGSMSRDGRSLAFMQGTDRAGTTADIIGGTLTPEGGAEVFFDTAVAIGGGPNMCHIDTSLLDTCQPVVAFSADSLVVSYCPAQSESATIEGYPLPFAGAHPTPVSLLSPAFPQWSFDSAGDEIFAIDPTLLLGNIAQIIDPGTGDVLYNDLARCQSGITGLWSCAESGIVTASGATMFWVEGQLNVSPGERSIWRGNLTGTEINRMAFIPTGGILEATDQTVAFYTRQGAGGGTDLYESSYLNGNVVTRPVDTSTDAVFLGVSNDGTELGFLAGSQATTDPTFDPIQLGSLQSIAVAGGGAGASEVLANATSRFVVASGTSALVLANYRVASGSGFSYGSGDLVQVDLAAGTATVVASEISDQLVTNAAGTTLVFGQNGATTSGVYALPIP
jgi:hypothetical protein